MDSPSLKILPAYTGIASIHEALGDARASRLLWLEILTNDQLDITPWEDHPIFQEAYDKACRWYTTYRSVIESVLARQPLPLREGTVDHRDQRTFFEAIRFAAPHT